MTFSTKYAIIHSLKQHMEKNMAKVARGTQRYNEIKAEILAGNSVVSTSEFKPKDAIRKRINHLKNFLKNSGRKAFVLGISGGVDSSTTGKLCQLACEELRAEGYFAQFVAVRLPAGVQMDEAEAQEALKFINPDRALTVNIGEAATNLSIQGVREFRRLGGEITESQVDFNKGNMKARLRMLVQYQIAAMYEGVVVGTDHNAEYVMAFYTRFGDEACDVTVLNGLSKRQIRLVAKELGASETLWKKPPTADLEELNPGKLDDEGFGFNYDYMDDFLEGIQIPEEVEEKIINHFDVTRFKRSPIPGFKES